MNASHLSVGLALILSSTLLAGAIDAEPVQGRGLLDTQKLDDAIRMSAEALAKTGKLTETYKLVSAENFYFMHPHIWKLKYKMASKIEDEMTQQEFSAGGEIIVHADLETQKCTIDYVTR